MADQVITRVFTGGEIAPGLHARADTNKYASGLALCQNFIVRAQGGAYSRCGTKYIDELKSSAAKGRLIPFSFNVSQNYVLVFENNNMRVIKDGGYVLAGGGPSIYDLVTTYTTAELPRLIFTQDADVMTITHPDHFPAKLSRVADDNWTLANLSFAPSVTTPTGLAVVAVGTASGSPNKTYRYVVTAVDENGEESLPTAEVSHTINALNTTYGSKLTWNTVSGAVYYRVYRDPSNGTGVYSWVGDTVNLVFEDYNVSPDTSDSPPEANDPFAASADDQPATVGYFQQRQIFANTNNNIQKVFGTAVADYESLRFSRPARANDAVFFTIKAREVNEIRHIVGEDSLIFLTSGAEWKLTEGQERVLTPATIGVRRQSSWGASWTRPAVAGDSIIYVQEKGNHIRDLTYEFEADRYRGSELSVMADHLFYGYTIDEMDYSYEPDKVLWCIRSDGKLLGMTYQREHGIWGWHQHDTPGGDGEFESVTVIPENGRDAVYFIVKRTIDSATVRYIERLEQRTSVVENVWYVDCGLQYDGSPATVITGLDHLEGETVIGVADGNVLDAGEELVVTSGQVTIPNAASKVTLGLAYTPAIELLDIDTPDLQQTLKGKEISVSNVLIEIENSRGGWVGSKNDDGTTNDMVEIKPRFDSDDYDALALKSFKQEVVIEPNWGKGGGIRIEQRAPMPLNILAVIPDVDIS